MNLIFLLLPLELLLLSFVVFMLYVFIRTPHKFVIKFAAIPLLLIASLYAISILDSMLGKPYPGRPAGEFLYIDSRIVIENHKKWIELWVQEKGRSRLYVFAYKKEIQDQLEEAKGRAAHGIPQFGRFKRGLDNYPKPAGPDDFTVETYQIPISELPPKR